MGDTISAEGFCQVKTIPKIREKLGSGCVGQAQTRISFFLQILCFFVLFLSLYMFPKKKKIDRGLGGWCLDNLSFSRIFGFFLI